MLAGSRLNQERADEAARAAFAGAKPRPGNRFKVELGKRTLVRALLQTAALEV